MTFYKYISIFFISFLIISCSAKQFPLQSGDLLFTVGKENSEFVNAIKNSTSTTTEIPFSHVGFVEKTGNEIWVWEATSPEGVVKTSFQDFKNKTLIQNHKTYMAVGRIKSLDKAMLSKALYFAEQNSGKPYDYAYNEENDAYYCSELVRFAFTDSLQNPIFTPLKMSFKNKETGETEPFWKEHFKKLNQPIPEGMNGSNPADMAKSPLITIVFRYY